jgi:hypothetical protein
MNTTINIETYGGTVKDLLAQIFNGYTVNIWTPDGNAVLISEEELRGLLETLKIETKPKYKAELLESAAEPLEECVPLEEVDW